MGLFQFSISDSPVFAEFKYSLSLRTSEDLILYFGFFFEFQFRQLRWGSLVSLFGKKNWH